MIGSSFSKGFLRDQSGAATLDWLFLALMGAVLSIGVVPVLWEGSEGIATGISMVVSDEGEDDRATGDTLVIGGLD